MNDLKERLDRLVEGEAFAPLDTTRAISEGRRTLRRRTTVAVVGGLAVAVVAAAGVTTTVRWASQPDLGFGDPGERRPAVGPVSSEVAYPDLVTSRTGRDWVSISGFGWPIEDMSTVSTPDGTVALPEISRRDAESMCLPMLQQAAPEVPASAWHHSQSWVDGFPSRATLPTTVEAQHDGRTYEATCMLPGDQVPASRPDLERVPRPDDDAAIREHCSYLGHVDFEGWAVVTSDSAAGRLVAVLRSTNGFVATCALSAQARGRLMQLSALDTPPDAEGSLVYDAAAGSLVSGGRAPATASSVELRVGGMPTVTAPVVDGLYAVASPARTEHPVARLTAYDAGGVEVASYSTGGSAAGPAGLLPSPCFYTLETGGDGC